jgi:hypothetical protein
VAFVSPEYKATRLKNRDGVPGAPIVGKVSNPWSEGRKGLLRESKAQDDVWCGGIGVLLIFRYLRNSRAWEFDDADLWRRSSIWIRRGILAYASDGVDIPIAAIYCPKSMSGAGYAFS